MSYVIDNGDTIIILPPQETEEEVIVVPQKKGRKRKSVEEDKKQKPEKGTKRKFVEEEEEEEEEIENELFEILDFVVPKKPPPQHVQKRQKSLKDYVLQQKNILNPWLKKDGKCMFKNKDGQTCIKYICTVRLPNGEICGKDAYVKPDDISHKQPCKKHRNMKYRKK